MNRVLGEKLTQLVDRAGYGRGRRTALRDMLATRYEHRISLQTLLYWLSGERTPELASLRVLLDALGVHGAPRNEVVRLALPEGLLSQLPMSENRPSTGVVDPEHDPVGPQDVALLDEDGPEGERQGLVPPFDLDADLLEAVPSGAGLVEQRVEAMVVEPAGASLDPRGLGGEQPGRDRPVDRFEEDGVPHGVRVDASEQREHRGEPTTIPRQP
ncbi:MAG: hypothetical protein ABMA64_37755 [Myxococcota bacterium]